MIKNLIIIGLLSFNAALAYFLIDAQRINASDALALPDMQRSESKDGTPDDASTPVTPTSEQASTRPAHLAGMVDFDGSYEDLRGDLRDQGFDEALVRQIVFAAMKRDQQLAQTNLIRAPYWQRDRRARLSDAEEKRDAEDDQRHQLISLFGPEVIDDPLFQDLFKPLQNTLPFLSSEKQIAMQTLQQQQMNTVSQRYDRRTAIEESREDLIQQRDAFEDSLRAILTAEEYTEYQLRFSALAQNMRTTGDHFDYTEQEFRDIYQLRDEFIDLPGQPQDRAAARDRRNEINDRIADYLGAERAADYQRSQDLAYRTLKVIGDRYNASNADVISIYNEVSEARAEMTTLRSDASLSLPQRQAKMEEIWAATIDQVEKIGGKDVAASVQNNSTQMGIGQRFQNRPRR